MSIEGQGHFFTTYFPGFVCFVLYKATISGEHLQDHWSSGLYLSGNCADIYRSNKFATNGTYTVYNQQGQSFKVYCEFHNGFGYTYIDLTTAVTINLAALYTDASHVLIRDVRNDGHQYLSRVEQLARYKQYKLSLQFNAHAGYAEPQNFKMTPYIYVGFLPVAAAKRAGMIQGYRVNGADYTFTNCDANPNSYFVFLKNKNHLTATNYNPSPSVLVSVHVPYQLSFFI